MSKTVLPDTMTKEEKDIFHKEGILVVPQWLRDVAGKETKTRHKEPSQKIVVPSLPLSTKQSKKKRQEDLMNALANLVDKGLKKKPLIAKMREQFPKLSSSQICRFVNTQLKLKVIGIDTKFKTKPLIIKGKYWRTL
tara:strand:- start:678 stop:1088 length:411 start_codon:yes stop_codon:yes gene_type:complete